MGTLRQIKIEGLLMVDEDIYGLDQPSDVAWLRELLEHDLITLSSSEIGDEIGRFVITAIGDFEEIEEG